MQIGYVDQSREALNAGKTVWEEISGGEDETRARQDGRSTRARTSRGSTSRAATSSGRSARCPAASAIAFTWPSCCSADCNLLLLDEPTNDLDVDTLRALEEALLDFAGCAVVISHDRWFLDRIATHILAFEGDSHVEWFAGNFQDYEVDKKRRLGADGRPAAPDQVPEADALAICYLLLVICYCIGYC